MAGLLGGIKQKVTGLLGDPALKDAFWLTLASGADPARADEIQRQKMMEDEVAQREQERQLRLQQLQMQMRQQQEAEAQRRIGNVTMQHYAENPNAIAFGGPGATPQQKLAGLLTRGVDPQIASGLIGQSSDMPADARLYEWAQGDPKRMAFLQRGNQQQAPSNVQEWQYFNSLSPEDQQRFLAMKRSGQMFDVGGVPNVLTPSGSTTPLATPEDVARNRGQQAAATAAGTAAGEAQAAAPGKVASIDDALTAVQGIKDDPAIKNAYGVVAGRAPTLRQDTQDFEAKRDQVVEAISLAERGELKGTGPITDFEQKMLRSAKTILQNKLIGPELAQAEVNRVYEWLSAKRAAAAKIVPGSSPSQRARLKYNPATGEFE